MADVKQQQPDELVTSAGALDVNHLQVNGVTVLAGNGTTGTGSQRVTIASDNTAFTVNAAESGTWTVQPGNTANTTPWLEQIAPATSGGLTIYSASVGATKTQVKSSAGQLYGWYIYNSNTSVVYIQLFDVANGSITLGTTAPTFSLGIPASSGANVFTDIGIPFATAINWAATTTRTGSTAPTNTVDANFFYK